MSRIYDWCELDKDYDPKYFLRHEIFHRESLMPEAIVDQLMNKEVFMSSCYF